MKELWDSIHPSSQVAILSAFAVFLLGLIVSAILAWLRPESWQWAVVVGGFTIQIGLSVLSLRISKRSQRN